MNPYRIDRPLTRTAAPSRPGKGDQPDGHGKLSAHNDPAAATPRGTHPERPSPRPHQKHPLAGGHAVEPPPVRATVDPSPRTPNAPRHNLSPGKAGRPTAPMTPVSPDACGTREIIEANRRERIQRRCRLWKRWWLPPLLLLVAVCSCWRILKVDQTFSEQFIWPSRGARFIEISSSLNHPDRPGGSITIVVGGLNRASGTGVAFALLPSLEINNSRVFSLVYGSGIDDQDIVNKFDALVGAVHPREVTFFGSSMGGDVALELAAHVQSIPRRILADLSAVSGPDDRSRFAGRTWADAGRQYIATSALRRSTSRPY